MSKTICILPWNHLATHPNGNVSLCCISEMADGLSMAKNSNGKLLDLNNNKIEEIVNSETFCNVRKKMLEGQMPKECNSCYKAEQAGGKSKRLYENELYQIDIDKIRNETSASGEIKPSFDFIELRLGNICNLKCVTCNPNSSFLLKEEFKELRSSGLEFVDDYSWVERGQYDWIKNDNFWNEISHLGKNLKTIYINGGEPTLIKSHLLYLDNLIKLGHSKDIDLIYSINLTKSPSDFYPIWDKFRSVQIEASIDDIEHRNYFIRYPSKWEDIIKNLKEISSRSYRVQILQTVSILNVYNTPEFYDFFKTHFPNLNIVYNFVNYPDYQSIQNLPQNIKEIVSNKLSTHLPNEYKFKIDSFMNSSTCNEDKFNQFKQYIYQVESIRNLSYKKYFPDFAKVLNC